MISTIPPVPPTAIPAMISTTPTTTRAIRPAVLDMKETNDIVDLRLNGSLSQDGAGASKWTDPDRDPGFTGAIERARPGLLALAVRLTRDGQEAEEALQDTLERAWTRRDQLRAPEATGAWLRRILARTVVDRARGRPPAQPLPEEALEALLPDVADPLSLIIAAEDELQLRAALRRIPEAERLALVLHDAEGWPAAEIAALLDSSTGAVHKRIQRGRAHLLVALANAGPITPADPSCRLARRAVADAGLDFHTDSPDLAAHLAHCPRCPATLQAAIGVIGALGQARIERIDADQRVRLAALTEPDPRTA